MINNLVKDILCKIISVREHNCCCFFVHCCCSCQGFVAICDVLVNFAVFLAVIVVIAVITIIVVIAVIVVANHPFKIPLCWWRRQEDVWVIYLHLLRYNLIEEIQPKV